MKKFTCFVVGLLILSSFTAISLGQKADVQQQTAGKVLSIQKKFLEPSIIRTDVNEEKFIELRFSETNGYLRLEDKPLLPLYRETINLPFGTKITDISCEIGNTETIKLQTKILPTPRDLITDMQNYEPEYIMDETVYNSNDAYPNYWFDYFTGGGLDENGEHATFLTIRMFPARYNPMTDTIEYAENIDLKVTYEEPIESPFPELATYDLVIIAPSIFSDELQPLIEHKERFQLKTTLKTLEDIYNEYSGVDKPEQIKYFIKDALDTWNMKFVLLVGGLNSKIYGVPRDDLNQGTQDWRVPVRYTNLRDPGGTYDPGFISDLYYADIYDSEGNFSSWDNDRNGESDGFFAVWKITSNPPRDYMDLYPDVYLGRLACRDEKELANAVTKIIDYERLKHKTNWYEKMVGIGGDSHDDSGTNYNEGEVACDYVFENYMTEFTPTRLYASYKDEKPNYVPSPENIIREITAGCGHLLFEGHGNPLSWNTHWPGIFNWGNTPGGIDSYEFSELKNGNMLPICVIGGCHNSMFNVSFLSTLRVEGVPNPFFDPFMWTYGVPIEECFSWNLVSLTKGGTIASLGNTGLGYGAVGDHGDQDGDGIDLPDTLEAVGGYQIVNFYKTMDEGKEYLGECWGGSINKYLDTYPGMDDQTDCKTVEQWPILGDPSLYIGGYQVDGKAKPKIIEKYPILNWLFDLPVFQKLIEKL